MENIFWVHYQSNLWPRNIGFILAGKSGIIRVDIKETFVLVLVNLFI